jgi:hypothetical protein
MAGWRDRCGGDSVPTRPAVTKVFQASLQARRRACQRRLDDQQAVGARQIQHRVAAHISNVPALPPDLGPLATAPLEDRSAAAMTVGLELIGAEPLDR